MAKGFAYSLYTVLYINPWSSNRVEGKMLKFVLAVKKNMFLNLESRPAADLVTGQESVHPSAQKLHFK